MTTPYENFANGIIQYAVDDYRKALRGEGYRDTRYHTPDEIIRECEAFFRSDWYRDLTKVSGEYLISRLRKEFSDESNTNSRNAKRGRNHHRNSVYMLRK